MLTGSYGRTGFSSLPHALRLRSLHILHFARRSPKERGRSSHRLAAEQFLHQREQTAPTLAAGEGAVKPVVHIFGACRPARSTAAILQLRRRPEQWAKI